MRKKLLFFLSVLCFSFASAQIGQPFDITVCGGGEVYLADETAAVLGNLSPNDYTVTYHLSQQDADAGINLLPDPFVATSTMTVFVRVSEFGNPANYETTSFMVSVLPAPTITSQAFTTCDNDGINDGFAFIDLGSAAEQIWFSTNSPNMLEIAFYMTLTDAMNQVNPIPWSSFVNTVPGTQELYYTATDSQTGCSSIATITLFIVNCGSSCVSPTQLVASSITDTTFVLSWVQPDSTMMWEVLVLPAGSPAPNSAAAGTPVTTNPYVIVGLVCDATYDVYVRSICADQTVSAWSAPVAVAMPCTFGPGQPDFLEMCSDTNEACFDLTQNDDNIMGGLEPEGYSITYYVHEAQAGAGTNPIATPTMFCITQPGPNGTEVFARLENNVTGEFQVFAFGLFIRQTQASNFTPAALTECDADLNGVVTFDLTEIALQLNTANPLSYYTNSNDATSISGANAILNPHAFEMSATSGTQTATIFVRETVLGGCDIIYSTLLMASSNCNQANVCNQANSLCASLGVPFTNTTNNGTAQPGIDYGCLFTQPNPTWFFLPISEAGDLSFHLEQNSLTGVHLDLDFICWGPFPDPVTPCAGPAFLNPATQVGCSYSSSATEDFTILNAQPGQFYLLMITNFSNQQGVVTVTQTNTGAAAGEIDCSGMRLTAFVDSNANGTKEAGEDAFNLGQFQYEKNNNGITHNLTSTSGVAHIYDLNPANTYDVSYAVDPMYTAYYSVSPSSFNDLSVPAGGMAEYFFPVTLTQAYDDLVVALIPNAPPMPGFTYTNTIRFTNLGSQVASGTVTYSKPSAVSIASVSEAGATTTATGFTYDFTNLQQGETRDIIVTLQVPTIPTVALGQILTASVNVMPIDGDIAPENNAATTSQAIVGSWDPNDKSESRGEYVLFSDFGADDYLYYTIRFENEGTAAAQTVKINDVLESQLDETSVRMVSASHDYVLDRTGNVLNWTFENIDLPYASANPEGAKGYVQFKVKPKPGFEIGDVIENSAAIYFDFNPAIVTNTFATHFVQSMGVPGVRSANFVVYPNPAGDLVTVAVDGSDMIANVAIYDMLGKKVIARQSASNVETLDVSALGSGMYFVEIVTASHVKTTKKLVIK